MIKVLFVDTACEGHHTVYLKNLVCSGKYQSVCCVPRRYAGIKTKHYSVEINPGQNVISYMRWINEIKTIADMEHVDIIQIMQMDPLMKYFSFYLNKLKEYRIVVVYHHFWKGWLRKSSYLTISKKVDFAVVHTQPIRDKLVSYGLKNIKKFEYPGFGQTGNKTADHFPRRLLAFGATRYDKGLDILLDALKLVGENFCIYIVGKDTYFDKEYILEHSMQYREKVYLDLRVVSDEEKEKYFAETDIVVLPYRQVFDGASGPLCDGVIKEKVIIGPNHGSLKGIIEDNHIGYTFSSESPESLAEVISRAINSDFSYDEKAVEYKKSLLPERMQKEYEKLFLSLADPD
ncbi:MAG: glycosyltransferase family 4 protein [Lachnospiraceae bacterium]|nr:glycosyltransferase family 4 protein [Lachnospiraceae bacterium]